MELQHGRPSNCTGRLEKEIRCYDLLDKLGIAYDRVDHGAIGTMEECAAIDTVMGMEICKNLFLCNRQRTRFYLLMMPQNKQLKTKNLSRQIGETRLSFGSAEDMECLLDLTPGSVSVMGLMNDAKQRVQLLADKEVLEQGKFGCHPCINTSSLKFPTEDLVNKLLPAVEHTIIQVTL